MAQRPVIPAIGAILGFLLWAAPYEARQCSGGDLTGASTSTENCSGSSATELVASRGTYSMSGSVSCQHYGYYGNTFSGNDTATAWGECGIATQGTQPECPGILGGVGYNGWTPNQISFSVEISPARSRSPEPGCDVLPTEWATIGMGVEGCTGSTCCGSGAAEACVHQGGLFDGCVCGFSPIIIGLEEGGLTLTDAVNGVNFDLLPDGALERTSWTHVGARDGFLVLDRNRNGRIDSSKELFGSTTDQPPTSRRNGFNALTAFDANSDNQITEDDPIYSSLRLWIDRNHNGVSESEELQSLETAGLIALSLKYEEIERRDRYGNKFKYRSFASFRIGRTVQQRIVYDVFLVGR
jgi:hypothetical protein